MDKIHIMGHAAARWVSSAHFDWLCLILTTFCAAAWLLNPERSAVWLLILVSPWFLRFLFTGRLFKRTSIDKWLLLFILTGMIGIWTAYNRQVAWTKFFTLIGAALFFYIISSTHSKYFSWISWGISLFGCGLSLAFLFSNNFNLQIADLPVISQASVWWIKIRQFSLPLTLQHNSVGGILAVLLPVQTALGITTWHNRQIIPVLLSLFLAVSSAAGLAMSSSRGAWLALITAISLTVWWVIFSLIKKSTSKKLFQFSIAVFVITTISLLVFFVDRAGGINKLIDSLPGSDTGGIRVEIARDTLWLVDDYLITGSGLASFPGLYSRYMLLIPFFKYGYSHNMFLDIALEQGLFGLIAFCIILLFTAWRLLFKASNQHEYTSMMQLALMTSLGTMALHGLVDDAFYGQQGTPLLFIISGLATAYFPNQSDPARRVSLVHNKLFTGSIIGILLFFAVLGRKPICSKLAANFGAVAMSRVELSNWPEKLEKADTHTIEFEKISGYFIQALQWYPSNRTALHRLGLIALDKGEYNKAEDLLEPAFSQAPDHRGIKKTLGYAYAWQGQLPAARQLLLPFPEVKDELSAYAWWWQSQNHPELSALAIRLGQDLP